MARKKKPDEVAEELTDAPEASVGEQPNATGNEASGPDADMAASDDMDDAVVIDEGAPEPEPEPEAEAERAAPMAQAAPEPVIVHKAEFFPMLLGGVAAAVIGFGMARFVLPEGWPWSGSGRDAFEAEVSAQIESQDNALAALKAEIGQGPDLSAVTEQMGGLQGAVDTLAGRIGDVSAQIGALESRLSDLEKRPVTEAASPAAIAAYERELKALQAAMAAQRAEVEQIAAQAKETEASAEMTAQEAMTRAALSRIMTALDTGAGFADAAQTISQAGIALPPELNRVTQDGVATMAALGEAFPEAARAALARARRDEGGGIGGFLMTQLGARSLEPREGDDPDAVLSRAEAALHEGRLTDAVAELDALSEPARAEMAGWLEQAGTRAAAVAAAEALGALVNGN